MSIQHKNYTKKKTGEVITKHYAAVWNPKKGKLETGPLRLTEKQARMDETDLIRAIEQDKVEKRKPTTKISTIYEEWHQSTKPPVYSNNTWMVYGQFYNRYIKDVFGDKYVNKITTQHINKYITLMNDKYSAETVNKCINVLSRIFTYAKETLNLITVTPMDGVKRNKVTVKLKTTWDNETIEYFLSLPIVKKSHYFAMFCISLMLGARPEEVCGLPEDALLSDPCALTFDRSYDRFGVLGSMKTDGSHRIIPIPDMLYQVIKKQLDEKLQLRSSNPYWGRNDFMFVSPNGNPINPHQYGRAFTRLVKLHNRTVERISTDEQKNAVNAKSLPEISLYGCRHSFATNTIRQTPNPKLISTIMGNSVKTLLTNYVQPNMDDQKILIDAYVGKKLNEDA